MFGTIVTKLRTLNEFKFCYTQSRSVGTWSSSNIVSTWLQFFSISLNLMPKIDYNVQLLGCLKPVFCIKLKKIGKSQNWSWESIELPQVLTELLREIYEYIDFPKSVDILESASIGIYSDSSIPIPFLLQGTISCTKLRSAERPILTTQCSSHRWWSWSRSTLIKPTFVLSPCGHPS